MREYNADIGELRGRLANETARRAAAENNIKGLQNDIHKKQIEIDLHNFMRDRFEYDVSYFVPMEDFKEEFFQYRKANDRDKIRWVSEYYQPIFRDYGVRIVKGWIEGLKFAVA